MKYLMFLGVWAVAFFVTTPLFAQVATPTSVTEDEGSAVLVATVNVANLSHVQQDNLFTISFDISNRIGVQPGVKYGVLLGKTEADSFTVVDQRVYDEVLVLGEGEVLSKTITYRAPKALDGTYSLVLVIANESGLNYAFMPIAEVTLKQSADGLRIDTASCYLTVKGSDTTYSPQQRVDIVGGETLVSHCMVQNTSDKPVEATPSFEMRKYSLFGPMVSMVGGERTPITLASSERREIAIELPTVNDPQDYVVKLRLGLEEAGVTYRFQLQGASATIENVLFDKTSYSKGDMAEVTVSWSPVGTFNGVRSESTTVLTEPKITAIIVDENREACADPVQEPLDQNGSLVDTLLIPITKDCVLSTAEITIQDTEYGALARTSYSFENVAENVATPPASPTEETLTTSVAPQANVSLWLSLFGLLFGLGLLLHASWKRNKVGVNKTPLVVLLILLGSMVFGAEPASADTFRIQYGSGQTRKVFDITANLFNPSTPDPSIVEANGSLGITGTITHVNGTMSTSQWIYLYSSIDAGANNLLYSYLAVSGVNYFISPWGASVTAPGTLGSHTLKIKADVDTSSITLPFTVIAPAGAPCPATTINGCLLPARASGSSAGSCATTPTVDCNTGLPDAAGECIWSGTCSYSCNDSNWNPGYNACALELAPTLEPNLVSTGVGITEPPVYGGGGDIMFNDTRETDTFTGVWGGIKKAVHKILALDKPQQALAVYEGQTLDLSAGFENNSSTAINNQFTNRFYYQWGVTTGAWINVPGSGETVHASIGAGATRADFAVFTVPARESDTLYIRHCLDVLDQVAEYGTDGPFANCSISSVTVQEGMLVCSQPTAYEPWKDIICLDAYSCGGTPGCVVYNGAKNLTTNTAGPTESFVDEPVELVAQVVNNGSENTGGSFANLFQVADDPFGTGAVDVGTQVVDPLGGLGKAIVRFNYQFPASAAGTNKFIRVCADKSSADNSGVIAEANELLGDNCGPWNSILIKPGCPVGETKTWTVGSNTCTATTPAGVKNSPSTLTDSTGPETGTADFLCQSNRTWAAAPNTGAICNGAAQANLVSENLTVPGSVTVGNNITLRANSRNLSTTATGVGYSDNFSYSWGSNTGPWKTFAPSAYIAKPALNGSSLGTDDVYNFSTTTTGTLYIQHCVDSYNAVAEGANETPNCTVSGGIVVSPNVTCPGGILKSWTVGLNTCTGTTTATVATGVSTGFVNDTSAPTTGYAEYACSLGGSWGATPIDQACNVAATPNLVSENLTVPGSVTVGNNITLRANSRNLSTTATGVGYSDNFSYSWGSNTGPWKTFAPSAYIAKPALNGSSLGTDDVYNFSTTTTGTLYIQHCVDSYNAVAEGANETPNCTVSGGILVVPPNVPPTANAGDDRAITLPTQSANTLNAAANDTDGTFTVLWERVSGPVAATIANPTTMSPTFNGMSVAGTYVFRLTVTDDDSATAQDTMQVVVSPAPTYTCSAIPVAFASFYAGDDTGLSANTGSVYSAANTGAKCEYTCNPAYWWNGSACVLPDLSAVNLTPAANANFLTTDTITFTGTAQNSATAPITQGGWADVEIDWYSDGLAIDNLNAYSNNPLGSFAQSEPKSLNFPLSAGSAFVGTHRYRFNVDTDGSGVAESNEVNNRSAWVTFTVEAPPAVNQLPEVNAGTENITISLPTKTASPSGVAVNDPDGTIDTVEWTFESGTGAATPSITGGNTDTPTFTNLDSVGVYTFQLTVTDDDGGQNSDTMTVTVNPAPPWGSISANPTVVSVGGTSVITWDSEQYSACIVTGFPGSDSWSGTDGTQPTSPINTDTTYAITCDGSLEGSVPIRVNPDVTLTSDKYIVRAGEDVQINWNTNGNDESLCTLKQNGIVTTDFLNGTGSGTKTVTIGSRTIFSLSCGSQTGIINIEVRPTVWNS